MDQGMNHFVYKCNLQFCCLRMQALALFLDCCRHRAIQALAAAAKAALPQSGLQDLLTKLAATVQVHHMPPPPPLSVITALPAFLSTHSALRLAAGNHAGEHT